MTDSVRTIVVLFLVCDIFACYAKVVIYNRAIVGDRRNLDTTEIKGTTGYSNGNQKQENEKSSEIDETASYSQKLPGGEYDNSAYDLESELDSIEANYDVKSIPWTKVKVRKTAESDQRPYRFFKAKDDKRDGKKLENRREGVKQPIQRIKIDSKNGVSM